MDKLLSGINSGQTAKQLSQVVETVTCIECCKIYVLPETAACGHTLCRGCWIGRQTCPECASNLTRRSLKSNTELKKYSKSVQTLVTMFEKIFNIKLDECTLETPTKPVIVPKDPNNHVKAWLADSQNQFSAPLSSQPSTQTDNLAVEMKTCKIQVHTGSKKPPSPTKIIYAPQPPQDDWDKIETIPDTEDFSRNKENVGPMDFEPFSLDDEYTTDHPRRSSRKRELKNDTKDTKPSESSLDKNSSSNLSVDNEKLSKTKQNWGNVKRMRKEFSKLHKKNKNKLNVSIEMCKKTQSVISKPATTVAESPISEQVLTIDECTPDVNKKEMHNKTDNKSKNSSNQHDGKASLKNNNPTENVDSPVSEQVINLDDSTPKLNESKKEKSKYDNSKNEHPDNSSSKNAHSSEPADVDHSNDKYHSVNDGTSKENCAHPNLDEKETFKGNIPFLRKGALQTKKSTNTIDSRNVNIETINHNILQDSQTDPDDIQITIKVGSTLTNIFIKKKKNDVQVKLNTDQAAQTTPGVERSTSCNIPSPAPKECDVQNIEINIGSGGVVSAVTHQTTDVDSNSKSKPNLDKTVSTKKHTASAETVPFEITESVEKELSKVMECDKEKDDEIELKAAEVSQEEQPETDKPATPAAPNQLEGLEEMDIDEDIFASGSVKECNVQLLTKTKPLASEVLMPTLRQNKHLTQTLKQADKRDREQDDDDIPCNKKLKVTADIIEDTEDAETKRNNDDENQSCSMNYDLVMGQVFASIDADMETVDKSQSIIKKNESKTPSEKNASVAQSQFSQKLRTQNTQRKVLGLSKLTNASKNFKNVLQQKDSEQLFTLTAKESQGDQHQKHGPETQAHIENILTPGMCRDLAAGDACSQAEQDYGKIQATPHHDKGESDDSIYEDTPQKSSLTKQKSKTESPSNSQSKSNKKTDTNKNLTQKTNLTQIESQALQSIINISDTETTKNDKDVTVIDARPRETVNMETPSTVDKFCNQIKHNSTPVARKSLSFTSNEDKTLNASSSILAKNTQEREIVAKAFESSQFVKPLSRSPREKLCIAASCLTGAEVKKVERLCAKRQWVFVREYTNDLTHLVVGVDQDGRSQRTVKFMCAVAAGKWIVRYEWVEECLLLGPTAKATERLYEALDWTGDPGPQRSRLAQQKLFTGITFFCKPPFTVLDENILKTMLEAAGGTVVGDAREARVAGARVSLLLAEPEHTQENQFTYMALSLNIVPVNYEWALNCLGSYALSSILELLLCPSSLLPAATKNWPAVLITQEDDLEAD